MKLRKILGCLIFIICLLSLSNKNTKAAEETIYWSEKNAPIFYGAVDITYTKKAVAKFDIFDSRFRVFAKDFEDGDLTSEIVCLENNVIDGVVGEYFVKYQVCDSHNNYTELKVLVHIVEGSSNLITVKRTIYTTPSVWNMDLAGFSRCNYGDRQILGIYLPVNKSFKIRSLDSTVNLGINMLSNDSSKESGVTLKSTDKEYISVKNDKEYNSVPLLTTPVMDKGVKLYTCFNIELQYDDEVKPLDYYHYLDNEDNFKEEWKKSNNELGVIENEVLTILVPLADIDLLNKQKPGFNTLDEHLNYYLDVVNKMDEIIGLSLNPVKATDQNVRTKYLVKANIHGAGAAYYSGNHVGVHSASASAFFQMNWGGLHEIAHGYQGYLGKGTMGLGEVGNNIIGHYVQMNKKIYTDNGDWLGKLNDIEEAQNSLRHDGKGFLDVAEKTRLYVIINLFDTFEGEKTYAKMFSWYREKLNDKTFTSSTPNQDVYALFFAEEYQANILPYWNSWQLKVSDNVIEKITKLDLKEYVILNDSVSDGNLSIIQEQEDAKLKYGLVTTDVLNKYNIKSNLEINIDINDISEIKGKNILLFQNGKVVRQEVVSQNKININDLPVGSYYIKMPINFKYQVQLPYCTLVEGNNNINVSYKKYENKEIDTYLRITGPNNTNGITVELSNNNTKGTIILGMANLGNQNNTWAAKPNDVFVSLEIFDNSDRSIKSYVVKGNGYFTTVNVDNIEVELQYGYKIVINTEAPGYVGVYSKISGKKINGYNCSDKTITYIVTEEGLKLENIKDFNVEEILYEDLKEYYIKEISDYLESVDEIELSDKFINTQKKLAIVSGYNRLKASDQVLYTDFINKIIQGGAPHISSSAEVITIKQGHQNDIFQYLLVIDNEDNIIVASNENTEFVSDVNFNKAGEYLLVCQVKDSDGNIGTIEIPLVIQKTESLVFLWIAIGVLLIGAYCILAIRKSKKKKK